MTIKELIAQLEQIENKDMNVIIMGTDHTDYTYYNGVEETRTSLMCVNGEDEYEMDPEYEIDPYDIDIDGEMEIQEAFIIDAGQF